MREFKFRAWDSTYERMLEQQGTWFVSVGEDWCEIGEALSGEYPDVEVMQYTGIKDMNGVEIYEGDILSVKDGIDDVYMCEVRYRYGIFESYNKSLVNTLYEDVDSYNVEVIGNIYENKELLEAE